MFKSFSSFNCLRTITIDQIVEILITRRDHPSYSYDQIIEKLNLKNKKGEKVSKYVVQKICLGKTKVYEEEFKNKKMTYEEYLSIAN